MLPLPWASADAPELDVSSAREIPHKDSTATNKTNSLFIPTPLKRFLSRISYHSSSNGILMKNERFEWRDGKSPLFKVFQCAIDPETEDDPATAPQPVVSAYVSVQV